MVFCVCLGIGLVWVVYGFYGGEFLVWYLYCVVVWIVDGMLCVVVIVSGEV